MGKLLDRLEKLLTGYTAAERADIQRRYIDWRVERVIVGSLERLTAEDEAEDRADDAQGEWHHLRTAAPVAEADLPPVVRAFARRVSAAYDETATKPANGTMEVEP